MTVTLDHGSLGCVLRGAHDPTRGVVQFRGIRYATVPRRFAAAQRLDQPISSSSETLDCTEFGPRCPQVQIDVGHLLRLPSNHVLPVEPEDEFACLNLDVCAPEGCLAPFPSSEHTRLPVLIWVHGGSQAMTFGSSASKVCDMTKIVSDSARLGAPIIAVSVQYRLNVFAHGDDKASKNLALSDQDLAIQWVHKHIAGFGGDPENITLAGESAGAVHCHAHLVTARTSGTSSLIKQCMLLSGSLALSPPQPRVVIDALRDKVSAELQELDSSLNLDNAPVDIMVEALRKSGIHSWFLESEDRFDHWQERVFSQRLLVSDVQFESVLWRNGIWAASTESILEAFDLSETPYSHLETKLKQAYGISSDRPSACKLGALDFINDCKFLLPAERLAEQQQQQQQKNDPPRAFRCIIDELNPWQPSHGAHHAVDLVLLFGGFDEQMTASGALKTGRELRKRFIRFINGSDPWNGDEVAAFGPYGMYQELDRGGEELGMRRRMDRLDVLREFGDGKVLDDVFLRLARGRISLLN
ncbi:Alpha/Beta hydrolase protein [Microdochium trichocladiopsis]|uniref:Carboxylic ester hydrolase n=1 Tax=Microdochium trichocladiopsis TaxID=1682393 RepID=A0A9P9BP41_9PEZI|nr:Alpha/Beta hydrolase protein [Microdochium trichocladiopsis]KAH7028149.1 Alpha/Beta hydrolase protein [Microdochium trichocladiopsis]